MKKMMEGAQTPAMKPAIHRVVLLRIRILHLLNPLLRTAEVVVEVAGATAAALTAIQAKPVANALKMNLATHRVVSPQNHKGEEKARNKL